MLDDLEQTASPFLKFEDNLFNFLFLMHIDTKCYLIAQTKTVFGYGMALFMI